MSRVPLKVPIKKEPDFLSSLAEDIVTKHLADGAATLLPADISAGLLAKMAVVKADIAEQEQIYKDSEALFQQRNLLLGTDLTQNSRTPGTILFYISSVRDILLGVYNGEEKLLGKWGFTVNMPKGAVSVPLDLRASKMADLAREIIAKHTADGAASPLPASHMVPLQDLLTEVTPLITATEKIQRDAETATQARNVVLGIGKGQKSTTPGTVYNYVIRLRKILLGHFRGTEQRLGDWGYTVNMSGPATPPATPPTP